MSLIEGLPLRGCSSCEWVLHRPLPPHPPCSTYSSLISAVRGRTRLQQVVEWLGGASFEGAVIFDEAHKGGWAVGWVGVGGWVWMGGWVGRCGWVGECGWVGGWVGVCTGIDSEAWSPMGAPPTPPRMSCIPLPPLPPPVSSAKNFVSGSEAQSTKVSLCVLGLQAALPRARVVYASATGVSGEGCAHTTGILPPSSPTHPPPHPHASSPPPPLQRWATSRTWLAWGCGGLGRPSPRLKTSWHL